MGCFDTVVVRCPKCNSPNEIQNKAGECKLSKYTLADCPPEIAVSLTGSVLICKRCDCSFRLVLPPPILLVVEELLPDAELDIDGNRNRKDL